uniref:Uncharacterized protein n=1 Tax=Glossina pallidipes TaxID=7398 RepID=A0A1A9ZSG1_GLOPL
MTLLEKLLNGLYKEEEEKIAEKCYSEAYIIYISFEALRYEVFTNFQGRHNQILKENSKISKEWLCYQKSLAFCFFFRVQKSDEEVFKMLEEAELMEELEQELDSLESKRDD